VCHVAYVVDGEPRIIPTLYLRRDDHVYLHGNRQSALLKHLGAGGFACLSVMSLDGVVVARSGFHCSMNYRSAVVFGNGEAVADDERESILDAFVEALLPGHQNAVRAATPQELNATGVVRLPRGQTAADRDLDENTHRTAGGRPGRSLRRGLGWCHSARDRGWRAGAEPGSRYISRDARLHPRLSPTVIAQQDRRHACDME
jgi:nitroimidazol reductase NimA-like FMN-containing flavoprotein (pyridoxamine 5'-phosphate oxidase superfamily)